MILFERQRRLIRLLDALGGAVGNLDFQKLLFLYCQESPADAPYEFVPYKFGAFSFTSYGDRRKLTERGLLREDAQRWRLTDEGRRIAGDNLDMDLTHFSRRYKNLRGDALVAETYRRFPYFATRARSPSACSTATTLPSGESTRHALPPALSRYKPSAMRGTPSRAI